MTAERITVRRLRNIAAAGAGLTSALIILILFFITKNTAYVKGGLLVTAVMFAWGAVFLYLLERKLAFFSDSLCRTVDRLMNGDERPDSCLEEETLFAKISVRLERLCDVLQTDRNRVRREKEDIQSMISDISHQTKTVIANLKMLNDTLLTRPVPERERREFLTAAGSQLDKLDFLIRAMIKTSRLETGMIILEKKNIPVIETVTAAINGVLAALELKGLELAVDCPEELALCHDSRWTGEALFNLLDNAVKYTPEGGSIRISVVKWEMYVKIDVADTGRGIPESEQASIFGRFYRESEVHDVEGIGIGLYLTREIVTRQGGYVKVTSEPGGGAVFSIFLPVR